MIAHDRLSTWWEDYEKQFDFLEKVPPCDPSNLHKEMLIFMHLPGSSLSVYGTVASSLTAQSCSQVELSVISQSSMKRSVGFPILSILSVNIHYWAFYLKKFIKIEGSY